MRKPRKPDSKPKALRVAHSNAEVKALLDDIDRPAVAAQLASCRSDQLVKQPFLRTLVQRSVDRVLATFPFAGQ